MKRITTFILSVFIVLSLQAQQVLRNKKYDLATAGSGIAINLASDAQIMFVSGTKVLSAPYAVTVTGTPIDGKTIVLFYDGTAITTGGNAVTLLGVVLTDKQATSKLIALSIYKTNAWVTRITNPVPKSECGPGRKRPFGKRSHDFGWSHSLWSPASGDGLLFSG